MTAMRRFLCWTQLNQMAVVRTCVRSNPQSVNIDFVHRSSDSALFLCQSNSLKWTAGGLSQRRCFSSSSPSFCQKKKEDDDNLLEDNGKQFSRLTEEEEQTFADEREFVELKVEMYEGLIHNENDRERLEQVLADYELIKYDTGRVPSTLSTNEMQELMQFEVHQLNQKTQMLIYFYKRELGKIRDRQRRQERKRVVAERLNQKYEHTTAKTGLEFTSEGTPVYGKWRNTMFVHKSERSMRAVYEWRAAQSALFGHKMVFDFGFEQDMKKRELLNLGVQMGLVFADNTRNKNPFDLWFCNMKSGTPTERIVKNNIGHMHETTSLINITEKSYLELFDRQQLIYLSPNASTVLREIPPQAIFVIGCIVDRAKIIQLTAGKASSEKVRCYKLPLDDYLFFKGNKVLTVNQVFSIMNSVKEDGDWQRAFDLFVPKRKLKTCEEVQQEQERKIKKFLGKRRLFSSRHMEAKRRVEIPSLFIDKNEGPPDDRKQRISSKANKVKQTSDFNGL